MLVVEEGGKRTNNKLNADLTSPLWHWSPNENVTDRVVSEHAKTQ